MLSWPLAKLIPTPKPMSVMSCGLTPCAAAVAACSQVPAPSLCLLSGRPTSLRQQPAISSHSTALRCVERASMQCHQVRHMQRSRIVRLSASQSLCAGDSPIGPFIAMKGGTQSLGPSSGPEIQWQTIAHAQTAHALYRPCKLCKVAHGTG